ncbi:MAG TPA: isochorismatase family cysteine hydrolase [Puia sp.]|nr:isochorismatase family cysteine hydrolase [Puia sp.]
MTTTNDTRDGTSVENKITIDAKPGPIIVEITNTAVIVVDMQNDFGSRGGMFDRMGIDISMIRKVISPMARFLETARKAGIKIIYLKMGYHEDLSDLGSVNSPNHDRHLLFHVGDTMIAPNGSKSRILIRDNWGTDIVPELRPQEGDLVIYKTRFSGFYNTSLDDTLKSLRIKNLIVAGCTTSICVESTVRDAMFRDYSPVVLEDCTAEPIGHDLPRSNHEASLLIFQTIGWVSNSEEVIKAIK